MWFLSGLPFSFALGHSVFNQVWARVVVPLSGGDETVSAFGGAGRTAMGERVRDMQRFYADLMWPFVVDALKEVK